MKHFIDRLHYQLPGKLGVESDQLLRMRTRRDRGLNNHVNKKRVGIGCRAKTEAGSITALIPGGTLHRFRGAPAVANLPAAGSGSHGNAGRNAGRPLVTSSAAPPQPPPPPPPPPLPQRRIDSPPPFPGEPSGRWARRRQRTAPSLPPPAREDDAPTWAHVLPPSSRRGDGSGNFGAYSRASRAGYSAGS
jgi:hypothetical protein